jgi:hypothetical protein
MSKRENFYRRDPNKALSGMIGLSLEERGVYNTIIDMLYQTWRPLEDDRRYIANWCGCAVQKLNPIIDRLIAKGRLLTFEEGGRMYLSDEAFEAEREAIKGASKTRSGRAEVREKSGEVEEKSASVRENPPLLNDDIEEKQSVIPLDKTREEKIRNPLSPPGGEAREGDQKPPTTRRQKPSPTAKGPEAFERLWVSYPHSKGRSSRPKALLAWQKLDPDLTERLPDAAARFGKEGREPNQECGAKALERWLADGNFGDWLETTPAVRPSRRFPSETIRQAVAARLGDDFCIRWLDVCEWQEVPARVIRAPNRYTADQLVREAREVLKALDIHSVKIAQEAA